MIIIIIGIQYKNQIDSDSYIISIKKSWREWINAIWLENWI